MMKPFLSLLAVVVLALPVQALADTKDRPIFDTHVHYSHGAWDVYSPAQIIEKFDKAGVGKALVSSRPDDGTLKLYNIAPKRVVPGFRPYKESTSTSDWYNDPDLVPYSKERLARGLHRVFGEVHLFSLDAVDAPNMDKYLAMVAKHGLILQPHSDAAVVRALFKKMPDLKILWAHAGMSEPASVVGEMLDTYPNLWTETSFREDEIMTANGIDKEWEAVFLRHPDRIMIGTDTWVADRWHDYRGLVEGHRAWLKHLPSDVADRIAYKNAEGLLGAAD